MQPLLHHSPCLLPLLPTPHTPPPFVYAESSGSQMWRGNCRPKWQHCSRTCNGPSVNGSDHCGPIASGSGKTTLWQLFKAALQKMSTPSRSSHTPVLVLTSSDNKYPCACFCVDFNLVWQIISVSSSLFVTTTVALFLTFLLPCFWPSSTKLLLLQWPSFWPSYYNNISTVYIVHVWYYNKQSFKPSTKHLLLFFILYETQCVS